MGGPSVDGDDRPSTGRSPPAARGRVPRPGLSAGARCSCRSLLVAGAALVVLRRARPHAGQHAPPPWTTPGGSSPSSARSRIDVGARPPGADHRARLAREPRQLDLHLRSLARYRHHTGLAVPPRPRRVPDLEERDVHLGGDRARDLRPVPGRAPAARASSTSSTPSPSAPSSYRTLQPPGLINRYAAMPSLHFGWNLLVGIVIWRVTTGRALKVVAVVMPVADGLRRGRDRESLRGSTPWPAEPWRWSASRAPW